MTVKITEECIGCAHCVDVCPEVFDMGESVAVVKVNPVPAQHEAAVRQAADECPTAAIAVE